MRRVTVHIDRLVLGGFRLGDRQALATGLQQGLARILGDPRAASRLAGLGSVPRLRIGTIHVEHGTRPQRVGERIAQSIDMKMH